MSAARLPLSLALAWTAGIVVGGILPGAAMPDWTLFSSDKLLHLGAFTGFVVLWRWAFPEARLRIMGLGLLLGLAIELYQGLIPDRYFSLYDLIADGLGLLLGAGLSALLHRRSRIPPVTPA